MKKLYLLLPIFVTHFAFGQDSQLYYSGQFLNSKKKAQSFLKIYNKNSGVYELTDEQGFAIIAAKPYDTLVWNNGKDKFAVSSYQLRELKSILESKTERGYVDAVYSKDYDSLLPKAKADAFSIDNSDKKFTRNSDYYYEKIKYIKPKNDSLFRIKGQPEKTLVINGSFSTSFDVKNRNAIPETQNRFVQGRSDNGNLIWRGPETNEMFSFGPDISTLAYSGLPYEYDQNGKLVPLTGGSRAAKAYRNELFKTVFSNKNQLSLNTIFKSNSDEKARLALTFGQQKDQMYFADQFDVNRQFKSNLTAKILKFDLSAGFNYQENKSTNTNRIALYNRAYQNFLLTPNSFSNAQGFYLSNGNQRSYSSGADHPQFLFDQNQKYNFYDTKRQFSFGLGRNRYDFKFKINQSFDDEDISNTDIFKKSTAGFINGFFNERNQHNKSSYTNAFASYKFGDNHLRSTLDANFILNHKEVQIAHSAGQIYRYLRTAQDYIFNYNLKYDDYNDFSFEINAGNSFYVSNTALNNKNWLPKINGFVGFDDVFDWYGFDFKAIGAYTKLASEPDITKSYGSYATTLLLAQNSNQYFPLQEVNDFKNLKTVDTEEWKTGVNFNYRNKLSFEAEYFEKRITNDIFPVFENGNLKLKNLADHTYKGFEMNFSYTNYGYNGDFRGTQKVSFFKYRDVVNHVQSGYNNLPLAGFSDVFKTLSEGQILGAVMGSYYERNYKGQIIIDANGYPVKSSGLKVIADPTPDFVMKFNHQLSYKIFTLNVDWEWKKGGQIWNGTQAVLDYYGRSQSSAEQRNITNYIFEGVNSNGNVNQTQVDFYNQNQDVMQNRWFRYGYLGVAEEYVQNSDYVRINNISLTANLTVGDFRNALGLTFYVSNILLHQANSGADPNQNFFDTENGRGLDFFNLPSFKTFGCMVSFKF